MTDGLSRSAAELFAAGFQDHGGKVLGIDETTAGAGANARTHSRLMKYFEKTAHSPFERLPRGADFLVAIRRFQRVGLQSGKEIEDLGVKSDYRHAMTLNDILNGNVDLINHAAKILVNDLGARKHQVHASGRASRVKRSGSAR